MKSNTFIILSICVVLVAGFCLTASAMQADGERPTRKCEHLSLTDIGFNVDDNLELSKQIVQLDNQGWEMVSQCDAGRQNRSYNLLFQTPQVATRESAE